MCRGLRCMVIETGSIADIEQVNGFCPKANKQTSNTYKLTIAMVTESNISVPLPRDEDMKSALCTELEDYIDVNNLPAIEDEQVVMAIAQEAKRSAQRYIAINKVVVKAVLSAVWKQNADQVLTTDEQTLTKFAEYKRDLFAALGADFANVSKKDFFVIITEQGFPHITTTAILTTTAFDQSKYIEIAPNVWFKQDMWSTVTSYWKKFVSFIESNNTNPTAGFIFEMC